ncbi:uncharacterized protein LOC117569302 [Drosophila albomicans]|uniref:Uncharacterized protein LOC117569302 n=1 Tax=Drosophila albomicans TaxID=7291 RepID=A0A6P8X3I7_DROAB|nr:uncharacterized protein LOC117569302 [Drosophila albomicans]
MHNNIPKDDDLSRNHIFLTPNGDYSRHLIRLCERCVQHEKKVLLLTQRKMSSIFLEKPRSLQQLQHWLHITFKDIESAPRRLIELVDCAPRPHLIVFDMHSIIAELICRPVLQQCSRETLVRLIAKCAAAFCNYREMLRMSAKPEQQEQHRLDTIVIMPSETYPLSAAQFKLLIGLYFYGNKLFTNFTELAERIRVSQGLR